MNLRWTWRALPGFCRHGDGTRIDGRWVVIDKDDGDRVLSDHDTSSAAAAEILRRDAADLIAAADELERQP